MKALLLAASLCGLCVTGGVARSQEMPGDYAAVLRHLDRKGDYKANVLKINVPRNDLSVTIEGEAIPTPYGFGGWLAMTPGSGGRQVMMGDLVLLQEEVNPIMTTLLENGLEVTALHNHFFYEQPRIFYMHVHGAGTPMELARKVKPALDLIGKISRRSDPKAAGGSSPKETLDLDAAGLNRIVGQTGDVNGAVLKYTLGREDLKIRDHGAVVNARMGLNTWAAFYGTDQKARIAGDVAMLSHEVQPVLKTLGRHGIEVVAIHNHMFDTEPMIFFLHYMGKGPAVELAKGFKAALNELGRGKNARSAEHEQHGH